MNTIYFIQKLKNLASLRCLCWLSLTVLCLSTHKLNAQCSPDLEPPTTVCVEFTTLQILPPDSTYTLSPFDLDQGSFDNCTPYNQLDMRLFFGVGGATPPPTGPLIITIADAGSHPITLYVGDANGNFSHCLGTLEVVGPSTIHVAGNNYDGVPPIDSIAVYSNGVTSALSYSYSDSIIGCPYAPTKIFRTYTIIDWFSGSGGTPFVLPSLDTNNDGVFGDAYDVALINGVAFLIENGQITTELGGELGDQYSFTQEITYQTNPSYIQVNGIVFQDLLSNCDYDANEPTLSGWKVKAVGVTSNHTYTTTTDANGFYEFLYICPDDNELEISVDVPFYIATYCPSVYTVNATLGQVATQNLQVLLENQCALLNVDIVTPKIRNCVPGIYAVNYCNLSTETVPNATIEVTLDPLMAVTGSSLPGALAGQTWTFDIGTLDAGECGQFNINYTLACNAPYGTTYCATANIFPANACPNLGSTTWNGARLAATARCDGDSVRFNIKNNGTATMPISQDFVVVEDLIMYMAVNPTFQLMADESFEFSKPANGATWRIETDQVAGVPFGGLVSASIEGCGGFNSPGLVNSFPINDPNPFTSTFCLESIISFDPNDTRAFPVGYGNDNLLEANTDIEYMIRFQNTGSDLTYNVVLLDSLATFLDEKTIKTGASSHPFDLDVLDGRVLRFTFADINLPQSSINELGSNGFVKFRISQKADNPISTVITNQAAIYFDYNAPIFTNTVYHTIGKDFIEVIVNAKNPQQKQLKIWPNPATDIVHFEMPETVTDARFELMDVLGQKVRTDVNFTGKSYRFDRTGLNAGTYFFQLITRESGVYSGKIMLK
jgi:hypothetical protein